MESEGCKAGKANQRTATIVSPPTFPTTHKVYPRNIPRYQRKFSQTFTKRQSPEWKPTVRRYSVETGQLVFQQDYADALHIGYNLECKIDFTASINHAASVQEHLSGRATRDVSDGGSQDGGGASRRVESHMKAIRSEGARVDGPSAADVSTRGCCDDWTASCGIVGDDATERNEANAVHPSGHLDRAFSLDERKQPKAYDGGRWVSGSGVTHAIGQGYDELRHEKSRTSPLDTDCPTQTAQADRQNKLTRLHTTVAAATTTNVTIMNPPTGSRPSTTCCAAVSAVTRASPGRAQEPPQQEATGVELVENRLQSAPAVTREDEALAVSVGEKLRMQDEQRKHVILSMALKHLISPEQHTSSRAASSCRGSGGGSGGFRSRSCSFGPARSAGKGAALTDVVPCNPREFGDRDSRQTRASDSDRDAVTRLLISEETAEASSIFFVSSNLHQVFDRQQKLRLANLAENSLFGLGQFTGLNSNINKHTTTTTNNNNNNNNNNNYNNSNTNSNNNNPRLDDIKLQAYKQQYLRQLQSRHSNGTRTPPPQPLSAQRHITANNPMRQLVTGRPEEQASWRDQPSPSDCYFDNFEQARAERPKSTVAENDLGHEEMPTSTRRSCSAFGKPSVNCDSLYTGLLSNTSDSNLEALIVESWLDDHPAFTHDYFMRKAPRQMIDDWLVTNARVSNTNLSSQLDLRSLNSMSRPVSQLSLCGHLRASGAPSWKGSQNIGLESAEQYDLTHNNNSGYTTTTTINTANNNPSCGCIRPIRSNSQSAAGLASSRALAGSLTPIRKISATDFETRSGSGFLRPMLSKTPDGRLTFLPQTNVFAESPSNVSSAATRMGRLSERAAADAACHVSKKSANDQSNSRATADGLVSHRPGDVRRSLDGHHVGQPAPSVDGNTTAASSDPCDPRRSTGQADGGHDGAQNEADGRDRDANEDPAHDEGEVRMIFELVKNIYDDLDIRTLFHKILKNIAVLINADRSSLFLVCGGPNDPNRRLVSQLFNIDQDSLEVCDLDESITIPWGVGLVGYVAESGEAVNIVDCYEDPRFTDAIDQRTGYVTRHMLCAPILDKSNEIVGVAQVINKRDGNPFSKSDEIKFKRYLQFCGIGLRNAQSYEQCQLENRRNQVLLDLARMVFEEQSTIEQVVHRIMLHTQSLLDCERCQVLLIESGNDELDGLLQVPSARQTTTTHCSSTTQEDRPTCSKRTEWRPQCSRQHQQQQRRGRQDTSSLAAPDGDAGARADTAAPVEPDDDPTSGKSSTNGEDLSYQQLEMPHQAPRLFSLVFDLECDGKDDPVVYDTRDGNELSSAGGELSRKGHAFPINIGITGYVATTGETLNIEDAHEHERFDASVDENCDFKHKSILCMPIRNGQRQIIGVIQLINKKNGQPFNKNDEDLFEAFAIFCGLGIHNTLMYERVLKVMAKQRVTFEVLSYHATAPLDEAKRLSREQVPSCFALNLASLKFNDFSLDEQYMLKSCLRFFLDLDLMRRFQIDQLVFCNWILSVQKNYRKVTYHPVVGGNGLKASPVRYHNWRHAFNVSQMMFAILVNTQICHNLGELETLALLIACLCHDLDHRGTNNSFQIKSASPLAELYSTSTMEHHHFDQCVMILNSQGNQILSNLSPEEYSRVIMLLEEAILATDLANYFQKRDHFFQLVNSGRFDWRTNPTHRSMLRCMLMTACDVAAITKPWPVQKVVADLVMSEFYQQGDIERNELKIEPIDMMNRDKMSELPAMQISFIDTICAPIYTAFAKLFPQELETLLDGCLTNRSLWREVAESNVHPEMPLINYLNCDTDGHESLNETKNNLWTKANTAVSKSDSDLPRNLAQGNRNVKTRGEKDSLSLSSDALLFDDHLHDDASQETMIASDMCEHNREPSDNQLESTESALPKEITVDSNRSSL